MISKIEEKLKRRFNSEYIEVLDESDKHHRVPQGILSHLRIVIVSEEFQNLKHLKRHKILYDLLEEEMKTIHALSLHLFTKEEWKPVESPKCFGGS